MSLKTFPFLKLLNCFLLVAVATLLVYNTRSSITSRGENVEEVEIRRRKRAAPDGDQGNQGVVGGQEHQNTGGGANYLCLPMDPLWANFNSVLDNKANIYGGEYQMPNSFPFDSSPIADLEQHNPPCAVCRVNNRSSAFMLPARNQCYPGWTLEYWGYLVTEHYAHKGRTEYICLDGKPEADESGYRDENGVLMYSVEGRCGSLPCPPYAEGRELTCAVCTK